MKLWPYNSPGMPEEIILRDNSPITRAEVRAIIMAKLRLTGSSNFLDIGAGTGAVAIEAGRVLTAGMVYAIEVKQSRVNLIEKNIERMEISNITVITGEAPEVFAELPELDRVFIGGSGGKLPDILKQLPSKLNPEGRVVMTAVTLETLEQALKILAKPPYQDFEALAVNLADLKSLNSYHLFQPEHTVYVLTAMVAGVAGSK